MSILIKKLKDIAVQSLQIKKSDITEFDMVHSFPFSEVAIITVEEGIKIGGINSLKEINEDGLPDSNDTLIVCRCLTSKQATLILLFSDPYELYEPTILIKAINVHTL